MDSVQLRPVEAAGAAWLNRMFLPVQFNVEDLASYAFPYGVVVEGCRCTVSQFLSVVLS